jgi:hypothetical protein
VLAFFERHALGSLLEIRGRFALRVIACSEFPETLACWHILLETGARLDKAVPTWLIDRVTIRNATLKQAPHGFVDEQPNEFGNNRLAFAHVSEIFKLIGSDYKRVFHREICLLAKCRDVGNSALNRYIRRSIQAAGC